LKETWWISGLNFLRLARADPIFDLTSGKSSSLSRFVQTDCLGKQFPFLIQFYTSFGQSLHSVWECSESVHNHLPRLSVFFGQYYLVNGLATFKEKCRRYTWLHNCSDCCHFCIASCVMCMYLFVYSYWHKQKLLETTLQALVYN
jgi:hypothetical protein